jgi:hypothetical protein
MCTKDPAWPVVINGTMAVSRIPRAAGLSPLDGCRPDLTGHLRCGRRFLLASVMMGLYIHVLLMSRSLVTHISFLMQYTFCVKNCRGYIFNISLMEAVLKLKFWNSFMP